MAVNLKSIYIRNFESVKETSLNFPAFGLGLVIGQNQTRSNAESVGSGKTALGEAISRTLLGARGRYKGAGLGAYSNDRRGNKDTVIKLEAELNGQPLTIWSGYKTKEYDLDQKGESLRFKLGDNPAIERGDLKETRQELNALLGVPVNLAEYAIHADGNRLKFEDLSETLIVDLFLAALATTNWEAAQKRTKTTIEDTVNDQREIEGNCATLAQQVLRANSDLQKFTAELPNVVARIQVLKDSREARITAAAAKVEAVKVKVSTTKKRQVAIKAELKVLEDEKAVQVAALELKLSRARSDAAAATRLVDSASTAVGAAKRGMDLAKAAKSNLAEPTTCPTCQKPWDQKHSAQAMADAEDAVVKATLAWQQATAALTKEQRLRDAANELVSDINSDIRNCGDVRAISRLSEEYEDSETAVDEDADLQRSLERQLTEASKPVDETAIAVLAQQIESAKARILELQADVDSANLKKVELATSLAVLQYWHKGFGPTGLPNMILTDSLPYMNHVSANLSAIMTGGLLQVSYSTTKTLASAEQRPELVIQVKNDTGAKKFIGNSKGEGGVANLIICETLHEIGRLRQRVNYRWLDEAVNSQDRQIRGSVYSYIRTQCRDQQSLTFAVDHSSDVEAHADFILLAEKSVEGFTSYRFI